MPDTAFPTLAELLTTAAAVANYRGESDVCAAHVLDALAVQLGEKSLEDLGRALSPLVRRMPGLAGGATPGVRAFAQRWFEALDRDAQAPLGAGVIARMRLEIELLRLEEQTQGGPP